ncbi:hypothetical protein BWI17_12085 [Betaproteobacteria bacterium GR16-43]|nr:hypothetical protein BWI17_12085 [Betaproteobacteria bacterium GR16-43]
MDRNTVFTKTAKGITQVNQKSASLSKDLMKVLKLIDGKSNFSNILEKSELDKPVLEKALSTLQKDGFARVFETRKEEADPFAADDDFDFTAPGKLPGQTQRVIAAAANDISELSRQQDLRDNAKKQMAQAQDAARAKAKAEAEQRVRLEADAKAKAEAEQRAMEQARRAKEAADRAKAEVEAKQREEAVRQAEITARAREEALRQAQLAQQQAKEAAERKIKEAEEAKRLAELRARAEAEANARAKAELEAKAREEEKRQHELHTKALAEEQRQKELAARAAAEAAAAKAKQDEESRRLAELRVKAEAEAKALADARSKAEAEAQALARARADAEAAAKKQAAQAGDAEKELKARLKDEIEARIRAEMESLLRNEIEEKARAEISAQIMAEAKLAAKAELEERIAEERATIHAAEAQARQIAEKASRERSEQEAKLRAEAEKRAAESAAAREKAEQESEKLRRQAVLASEQAAQQQETIRRQAAAEAEGLRRAAEAAAREKEEASRRAEGDRRAKIEAEARAMVEAEENERRQRELTAKIDSERKGREEAELRAKIESRARETIEEDTRAKVQAEIEGDMTKRAEVEGKAQARAYMDAKAKAEQDEDNRLRAEQDRKAREIADILRTKVEPDVIEDTPAAKRRRPRRRKGIIKNIFIGLVVSVIIAIGLLHVIPLRSFATKVEKAMSGWLHDDVAIASVKFWLVPTPHLKFEGLTVGKLFDAKAQSGKIYLDVGGFFSDQIIISSLELDNVSLSSDAVRRIFKWGELEGKKQAAEIEMIKLRSVKLDVQPPIEPFAVDLRFNREGALRDVQIRETGGKWTVGLKPRGKAMDVDFYARYWVLPLGAPIPVSEVKLKGTVDMNELVVPEFEADTMEGKVNGTLKVNWASGLKMESDLSLAKVKADELMKAITKDITVTGKLDGNFSLAAESTELTKLFQSPRAQGKFRLVEGSVSNVDLVAVMQSDAAGQRAGVTKFAELTGEVSSADSRTAYRNIVLQGGVLRGNGTFDIGQGGAVTGRLLLEIRSQVAQDRGSFSVTGTVAKPSIKRGG